MASQSTTEGPGAAAGAADGVGTATQVVEEYNASVVQAELDVLPLEGKTVAQVADAVKGIFGQHGVQMVICSSKRSAGRLYKILLKCKRGVANRQRHYYERVRKACAPNIVPRQGRSQRTGCNCQVSILHPRSIPHPKLSAITLEHLHTVDKAALVTKVAYNAPLSDAMNDDVEKMMAMHPNGPVNIRAVQNARASIAGQEKPWDATDFYHEVVEATAEGGIYKKRTDQTGRLTHLFWMTREQISLAARFGGVTMYNDTAVKNMYRAPLGTLVVIDGEFNSRLVGQSVTADTTTDTFVWMLKAYREAMGGKQPTVFIQDADAAMTGALGQVFPDAVARRCQWHLNQNLQKNLANVLGAAMKDFMEMFWVARSQTSLESFEKRFDDIIKKYPQAEAYLMVIYGDRHGWAEYISPLLFSVGAWTTSRVESINARIADICNGKASLMDVFRCFTTLVSTQGQRAALREAELQLGEARLDNAARVYFPAVLDACAYALGGWPTSFMEEEMGAAVTFCTIGSHMPDGPERAKALQAFEYIGEKLERVTAVACIRERRNKESYPYSVLRFEDGSHLCTCRTLQTLGVWCRHSFAAMLQSAAFGFNVGLVHEHWLNQRARDTPQEDWPKEAVPKWILADTHGGAEGTMESFAGLTPTGGGRWQGLAGSYTETVEAALLDLKNNGPSEQDRIVVYADVTKMFTEASAILSDNMFPKEARAIAEEVLLRIRQKAMERNGQADGRIVLGNMPTVRLPARASSKRKRSEC